MSLVDTETGEVVSRSALAIPRPHEVTSPFELCDAIEQALPLVDDAGELAEAKAKLLAIETYMSQRTKEGRARLEAALRRIEIRMGEVLGEAQHGGDRKSDQVPREELDLPLPKKERHELRLLAAHQDVAEQVIATSDDAKPPSRRKVLDAIRDHLANQKENSVDTRASVRDLAKLGLNATQIAEDIGISPSRVATIAREEGIALARSQVAIEQRESILADLAAKGNTSAQIAKQLGISAQHVRSEARRLGIAIAADRIVGKQHHINAERVIEQTIAALDGLVMGLSVIEDITSLDAEKRRDWSEAITPSLAALNRFKKELNR